MVSEGPAEDEGRVGGEGARGGGTGDLELGQVDVAEFGVCSVGRLERGGGVESFSPWGGEEETFGRRAVAREEAA